MGTARLLLHIVRRRVAPAGGSKNLPALAGGVSKERSGVRRDGVTVVDRACCEVANQDENDAPGDGEHGARLPSSSSEVVATYLVGGITDETVE